MFKSFCVFGFETCLLKGSHVPCYKMIFKLFCVSSSDVIYIYKKVLRSTLAHKNIYAKQNSFAQKTHLHIFKCYLDIATIIWNIDLS